MGHAVKKPSRALGVHVILRCPRCGHTYETTTSAGTGLKPGQTVDQEHLPGLCHGDALGDEPAKEQ